MPTLPTSTSNLETDFTCLEYIDVEADDDLYVDQSATGEFSMFLWKDLGNSKFEPFTVTWKGRSDRACSDSTVYLQIFDFPALTWFVFDSDSTTAANTEFTLTHTETTEPGRYYGPGGNVWVYCRVYQEAV